MKYLRGYLAAAIFGAITWVLMQFGQRFTELVDMVYPYVIRTLQGFLAAWSGSVDFLIWQVLAVALGVLALGGLVIVIVMKWNPVSWAGWVLALVSFVYLIHTALFGLNYYAGPLADDIRLDVGRYSVSELAEATEYYRDKANVRPARPRSTEYAGLGCRHRLLVTTYRPPEQSLRVGKCQNPKL